MILKMKICVESQYYNGIMASDDAISNQKEG
jgi:hypothetical protein